MATGPTHHPQDMAAVFDLAKTRIGNKRDQVEDALRDRVDKFETKVGRQYAQPRYRPATLIVTLFCLACLVPHHHE